MSQVFDTPDQIRAFQLFTAKHALLLEAKGLRKSRLGRNGLKRAWAKHYHMPPKCTHLEVIARIQQELDTLDLRQKELPL